MSSLAVTFFNKVSSLIPSEFDLSIRQQAILDSVKTPHAQDFLLAVPIEGLGQRVGDREFRAILCYRLMIPLFREGTMCPSCHVRTLDCWGDHALQCGHGIGFKFRHDLVRDILFDIMWRCGLTVQKEAKVGCLTLSDSPALRPADILIRNWDGKDMCVDVTGCSPMVGLGQGVFVAGKGAELAANKKRVKHEQNCIDNGFGFLPFAFDTFGCLDGLALDCMNRIGRILCRGDPCIKSPCFIFHRLGISIQKGVGAQLVARLPMNFV
ncbi:hypothetical protein ACHQM5_016578 [Ranunculus cassubicifolius]